MLEFNNQTKNRICRRKAQRLQEAIFSFYNVKDSYISLVAVGDSKMKTLNREYRNKDKTTDVLTFPLLNSAEVEGISGEIFINVDEAKRAHKYQDIFKRKRAYSYIFYFLFVHGLLHLIGYEDKSEKGRVVMVELGKKFMDKYYS